jgi:hypothetical protein
MRLRISIVNVRGGSEKDQDTQVKILLVFRAKCVQQVVHSNCDVLKWACDSETLVAILELRTPEYGKDYMGDFSVGRKKGTFVMLSSTEIRAYNSARPMTMGGRCSRYMDFLRPKGSRNV